MRGFHFSLRWLFGVVTFLAVGCGLLIYASPFLSKLSFTATIVALQSAVFGAIYRAGDRRAFWAGFAAFGFAYVWLTCGSWQSPNGGHARDSLVTTAILEWTHQKTGRPQTVTMPIQSPGGMSVSAYGMSSTMQTMMGGMGPMGGGMGGMTATTVTPDWSDFSTTGHSLFAIVFALLGGVVARGAKNFVNQTKLPASNRV